MGFGVPVGLVGVKGNDNTVEEGVLGLGLRCQEGVILGLCVRGDGVDSADKPAVLLKGEGG